MQPQLTLDGLPAGLASQVSHPALWLTGLLHLVLLVLVLQSAPVLQVTREVVHYLQPVTAIQAPLPKPKTLLRPKPQQAIVPQRTPLPKAITPPEVAPPVVVPPPLVLPKPVPVVVPESKPAPLPTPVVVPAKVAESVPEPPPKLPALELPVLPTPVPLPVVEPAPAPVPAPPPPKVEPPPKPAELPTPTPAPVPAPTPAAVAPVPTLPSLAPAPSPAAARPTAITPVAAPPAVVPGGGGFVPPLTTRPAAGNYPTMMAPQPRQRSLAEMANEQLNGGRAPRDKLADGMADAVLPDCIAPNAGPGLFGLITIPLAAVTGKCKMPK
jgi:hypothetical protein